MLFGACPNDQSLNLRLERNESVDLRTNTYAHIYTNVFQLTFFYWYVVFLIYYLHIWLLEETLHIEFYVL
jgi:hypothetical protein